MKKSLLALAVFGAFAGTASAQTSLTIYGIVDAGIRYRDADAGGNDSTWGLDSGMQSGSRIGFRGVEDLGGGVSAMFTLENGFNIDDGTMAQGSTTPTFSRLFGRQAFVGLQGGFGAVKLGRQYTPIRVAVESVDPFGLGLAGNAANVFNVHGERTDNTLNYTTPNFGGFSGQIAYTFGETTGFNTGRHAGASVGYANGPVNVVVAYHDQNVVSGATATAVGTTPAGDSRTALLGGTFDFGVAKLHAAYSRSRAESEVGVRTSDRDDAMLGVSAPVGPGTVLASVIRRADEAPGADADQYAIGYIHNVSKRTNFYTSYARVKNDGGATLGNNTIAPSVAAGADPSTFNIGVRHRF